jgi:two-component system sensor histidine kinase QseC
LKSIRAALLGRLALGTAALLLLVTGIFYLGARSLLERQYDESGEAKLNTLAALFEQEGRRVEFSLEPAYCPEFAASEDAEYLEVWNDERVLWRSEALGELDLPQRFGPLEEPRSFDLELPDGRSGRAVGARFAVKNYERTLLADPGPATITLVLARERERLDGALFALLAGGAAGSLLFLIGGLVLGRRVVDRGLAPVTSLVRHVEAISDPTAAAPYPSASAPSELQPIALGLNQLVERLAAQLERERRTSANIAHELRTPVSELLVLSEVALRCSDDSAHALQTLRDVREVSLQMRRLIGTLLELSRLESGQVPLEPEPVELAPLLEDCWQRMSDEARARGLAFDLDGARSTVSTDRGALGILCTNLLGNALEHSPEGSLVHCRVTPGAPPAIVISNPAEDLTPEDLDKLTEPFWRASQARGDRRHFGLGLALARRLAELLGIELSFALDQGRFQARLGFAGK